MSNSDDTGEYIAGIDDAIPTDGAFRYLGAAEIRKIKTELQRQFPNFTGAAVNLTEAELNMLDGIATGGDTVETRVAALEAADNASIIDTPTTNAIVTQTAGGDIQDSGVLISTDDTLASDSDAKVPTEQAVKAYVDALTPPLGVGQTWQDVRASRANATEYTNSTGRPIMVSVSGSGGVFQNVVMTLDIDGVTVCSSSVALNTDGSTQGNVQAVVPAGSTYEVNASNIAISHWAELR